MRFELAGILLLLGVVSVSGMYSYGYRDIHKDHTTSDLGSLFGRHAAGLAPNHRQHLRTNNVEVSSDGDQKAKHQRRTEGEPEVPPYDDDASSGDGSFPQGNFFPAENLDYYKKQLNPDVFEWVDPDLIAPGAWTCGFLKPELGTAPRVIYPTIRVYVCVLFAKEQPAKKGFLFTHCGGPSSLTDCGMAFNIGEEALNDYNILTIDQRGMGRSWPSFGHEECNMFGIVRVPNGTEIEDGLAIPPVHTFAETNMTVANTIPEEFLSTDYMNKTSVKDRLEPYKRRVLSCWTCEDCDFQLSAVQEDGSEETFHFLEYSGTRQLAEDIERIRSIMKAPVMNIYGVSYGTSVFGTYATLFPGNVGLMVLDGNVNPFPDLEYIAMTLGRGHDTRINYALFSCSARNVEEPESCPVYDLPKCFSDVSALLRNAPGFPYTVAQVILAMFLAPDDAQTLCDLAADGEVDVLGDILEDILGEVFPAPQERQGLIDYFSVLNTEAGPTFCYNAWGALGCQVYDNPEYFYLYRNDVSSTMVQAQDDFSALYNSDYFAKRIVEFAGLFTGAGTGIPVQVAFHEWAQGFYWPKGVPLAPIGNPLLTGIIAGQLYDPNTPYVWTQNMRNAFKYTSLLTSQATSHGLSSAGTPECQQHVIDYLNTGVVQIVDGTVCGADLANSTQILGQAFIQSFSS